MKWYQSLTKKILNSIVLFLLPITLLLFVFSKLVKIIRNYGHGTAELMEAQTKTQ